MDETMTTIGTESGEDFSAWDEAFAAESGIETENDTAEETETTEETGENTNEPGNDGEESVEAENKAEDQRYSLKHLDETREVTLDELIALGQKGLDYDRVKQQLTDLRAQGDAITHEHTAFLKELADEDGLSIEEFMDTVRAGAIAKKYGVDHERAMELVKRENQLRKQATTQNAGTGEEDEAAARRNEEFRAFAEAHKDLKPSDIPAEVWRRVSEGMSLSDSWEISEAKRLREENTRLKAEAEAKAQKAKNTARSTGSRSSSGNDSNLDPWEKAFSEYR